MIEKGVCETCKHATEDKQCNPCWSCGLADWQPSDLYTAYLAEKKRANDERDWHEYYRDMAERFRQALNCSCFDGKVVTDGIYDCPACAEIRKEAKI